MSTRPEPALDCLPSLVVDDTESLTCDFFPLVRGAIAVYAPPGVWVLVPLAPVERDLTHVLGVLEHEVDGVRTPQPRRARGIQLLRDCLFPVPVSKQSKDLSGGRGFLGDHGEAVSDGYGSPSRVGATGGVIHWFGLVSVGPPTGRVSLEKLP